MSAAAASVVSFWLVVFLMLSSCGAQPPKHATDNAARKYELQGTVVRLDPKTQTAVIKHEAIKGWMEAMTMEFPVVSKAEFNKLHPGDPIRATVFVKDLEYWIANVTPEEGTPNRSPSN